MSGWIFLAVGAVVAAVDFLTGLGLTRKAEDQLVPGRPGAPESAEQLGRTGRMLMMIAPLFLLAFAAIAFGFVAVGGVEPIEFN